MKNAQLLNVQYRGYNFSPVTLNRNRVILYGRLNYSVWHGKSEALCLNVLIVKVKRGAKRKNPIPQLLGYMGLYLAICTELYLRKLIGIKGYISRGRKDEKKCNYNVYGIVYTRSVRHFLKISHESKVSFLIYIS